MEKSLEKNIVEYILDRKDVSSVDIAETFLKFKSPNETVADIPVTAMLKQVKGCFKNDKGFWCIDQESLEDGADDILSLPWYVVSVVASNNGNPLSVSLSSVVEEEKVSTFWCCNPEDLDAESQEKLRSFDDNVFKSKEQTIKEFSSLLNNKIVLFKTFKEQLLLIKLLHEFYIQLPEDTYLLSNLLRAVGNRGLNKLSIGELYNRLYGSTPVINSSKEICNTFKSVIVALLRKIKENGVSNRDELINLEIKTSVLASWSHLKTDMSDILNLDSIPGVYGFTDKEGKYLYIGKALNLKRRLATYFRLSEESPSKLSKLRDESYDITIHKCGSELESLIYEQRLISKYRPPLNKKVDVNERKGKFRSYGDCIIVLPHHNKNSLNTFWHKKEEKLRIVEHNEQKDLGTVAEELQNYFYGTKLGICNTDFQELEIFTRWLTANRESVVLIRVDESIDGKSLAQKVEEEYRCYINNKL